MSKVRIPAPMQAYSNGQEVVEASGRNVGQLIIALEQSCPGIKDALMDDDKLKPDVAVAIDGQIAQLGLLQSLSDENEVTFIPAIGGG
jgi:sulfur-carrier protein